MVRHIKSAIILSMLMLLASCAVSYGPKDAMGGYTDEMVDEVTALVAFEGNQYNTTDQIRAYVSYRCSEVTLEKGFTHFMIMEDVSFQEGREKEFIDSDMKFSTRTSMSGGVQMKAQSTFGAQESTTTPIGIFRIKMMHGPDPAYPTASINAQTFIDANVSLIKRKK